LSLLNSKENMDVLIANRYIFTEISKVSVQDKEFLKQIKFVIRYYYDIDFLLSMIKKTPAIKKKDIQFKIYMQVLSFIENYSQHSGVEVFDPSYKIAIFQWIQKF